MDNILSVKNLKKHFGDVKAVDDISFDVEEGSFFCLLGANGAGKSVTINIICTLLAKDSGTVTVSGYDLDKESVKIRESIGIVFQNSVLDKALSVKDNLAIRASFYGLYGDKWRQRLRELTELLDLDELLKRIYGKLSGGQRRRVDIARALINSPRILILDEPTTGLDPQTRKTVWSVIDKLRAEENMTVFLTTHYMEESNNADKIVMIDSGKIAAVGSPVELKNRYSRDKILVYSEHSEAMDKALADCDFAYKDNCYTIYVNSGDQVKKTLIKYDKSIADFEVVKGNMDDVFLAVTGKKLEGGNAV